jgi:hypothetical protein
MTPEQNQKGARKGQAGVAEETKAPAHLPVKDLQDRLQHDLGLEQ